MLATAERYSVQLLTATATTTTTTGYPTAVELGRRPRPKPQWHDGGVRARLSITPIKCYH